IIYPGCGAGYYCDLLGRCACCDPGGPVAAFLSVGGPRAFGEADLGAIGETGLGAVAETGLDAVAETGLGAVAETGLGAVAETGLRAFRDSLE
ncbi:hypothetical protein, partial [Nocardia wallacei]|uniref:hypothetical protein n=1 Tax=Nocardia wallacei TaxID=480035 RepID=UPI00245384AA